MLLVPVCSAELECPLSTCNIACLFSAVCLCASIFQKALFASCTNLTWVDIRKRIKAGVKMSQYRLELLKHCRRQACQDPSDWRGLWGCCSLGFPLVLYFPIVFILWTFLIGTGEHRFVCRGIISPTVQRTLCRLPLVQIKPSVLVLSQAPLHSRLQSKGTHTHDERHASRKQKWVFPWKKPLQTQLYWVPNSRSHFPFLYSKILILGDSGLSFSSGSCLMSWNTS